jgi:hypothetical protein
LNIDRDNRNAADGDLDVLNDPDTRDDSEKEQSNLQTTRSRDNLRVSHFGSVHSENVEPRTGTYGKSAPTFLDNIRNLGSSKRENSQSNSKSADVEI